MDEYGAKVQARIKKLTEKYRKEERDREEAVRMAEKLLQENKNLNLKFTTWIKVMLVLKSPDLKQK